MLDVFKLLHQRFVDVQAAGGIDDDHIVSVVRDGIRACLAHDFHRIALTHLKDGHVHLRAHHLQLLDGGGAVNVRRRRASGVLPCFCSIPPSLPAMCGFTGALQAA